MRWRWRGRGWWRTPDVQCGCVGRPSEPATGRGGRGQGGRAGGGGRVRGRMQPQGAAQQPGGRGEVEVVVVVDP